MASLQSRLQRFILHKDINMQTFERLCGIGQGLGSRLSNKSYATTFARIAKAFPDLNIEWLKSGTGEMLRSDGAPSSASLSMSGHSQLAMRDIRNGSDSSRVPVLEERVRSLEAALSSQEKYYQSLLSEKDARISDLLLILGNNSPKP